MPFRLLLGIDDSAYAAAATRVALDLGERVTGCELTVLHVVNVVASSGKFFKDLAGRLGFEPAVVPAEIEAQYSEAGRALLAEVEREARSRACEVRTVLEHGAVQDRLVHHAEHTDLLVMGLRGQSEERFPGQGGNNVYNVLAAVRVPVMLVPEGTERIERIAIGYDGSPGACHAVAAVRRLTDKIPFEVHAVYVQMNGEDPSVLDEVAEQLPGVEVQTHVVQAPTVREGVVQVAERVSANLLAVGFGGTHRLRDFLVGSSIEYLMQDRTLMLLVAH